MKADRARVVVLGMMANVPAAGHTWLHLNWLRGIQMLGHEVWYVEDELSWPYDPVQGTRTDDYSIHARVHTVLPRTDQPRGPLGVSGRRAKG